MIRLRDAYILVVICLVPLFSVSYYVGARRNNVISDLKEEQEHERRLFLEKEKGYLSLLDGGLSSVSKPFVWPEGRVVDEIMAAVEVEKDNPFVVLFFGELSCNVCQDRLIQVAKNLNLPKIAVLDSNRDIYVNQFIRMNQIDFPTFVDDGFFAKDNEIRQSPALVLVHRDKITFAYYPLPGYESLSEMVYEHLLKLK